MAALPEGAVLGYEESSPLAGSAPRARQRGAGNIGDGKATPREAGAALPGRLPLTGADAIPLALVGALLMAIGAALRYAHKGQLV